MKFKLLAEEIEFLKKHAADAVALFSGETITGDVCIFIADYDDLLVELTYAVLGEGMDDEDTVNGIGRKLYEITDKIIAQAKQTA